MSPLYFARFAADVLANDANQFNKGARAVRKNMWWKNMKLNIIIGLVILAILAVIISTQSPCYFPFNLLTRILRFSSDRAQEHVIWRDPALLRTLDKSSFVFWNFCFVRFVSLALFVIALCPFQLLSTSP